MAEFGFLNLGYNKEGYNKKGFDKQGYDRDGYNKFGFNKDGFNRNGFDKFGYDRTGFDEQGYNASGFDKNGYDKQGCDVDGYDRLGRDRQGFDKSGYDVDGYDRFGFDALGYDHDGYNRKGFNKDGFDRDGYDCYGFDREGYDRQKYNKAGYNKEGLDREGYNLEGYNIQGYNRLGYDKNGFNGKGINASGINIWGYDSSWHDENGFDPLGYDKNGYDEFGLDQYGFNHAGVDEFGHHKEEFDSEGFHLKTGFNRLGFNREGVNINGITMAGEAPALFDAAIDIYDENGYSSDGTPKQGFNASLFLLKKQNGIASKNQSLKTDKNQLEVGDVIYHRDLGEAIIKELKLPYCTVVFTKTNVQMMFRLFDDYLTLKPSEKIMDLISSFDEEDYAFEAKKLKETLDYLKNSYSSVLKDKINKKWSEQANTDKKQIIDHSGFLSTYVPDYSDKAEYEFEIKLSMLMDSPYFARVCKGDDDFYIGKNGTDSIVDWQSPKCKFYYQYQIYVGIPTEQLRLIRDLTIQKSKFFGYIDKYNGGLSDSDYQKYADEHLKKIISANRNNKGIHDIITSIQQNQYEIMTEDVSNHLLVIGCAGSGKTMIMLHRISYLLYNNPSLIASNMFVLSPTKYLSFESSALSKTLNLGEIHKFTIANMYKFILEGYKSRFGINYFFDKDININLLQGDALKYANFYSDEYLSNFIDKINKILNKSTKEHNDFIAKYSFALDENKKQFFSVFNEESDFNELKRKVEKFVNLCKKGNINNRKEKGYSVEEVRQILNKNKNAFKELKELFSLKLLIEYFLQNNCFLGKEDAFSLEKDFAFEKLANACKKQFSFLFVVLQNLEIVEDQLTCTYSNKTQAVESILNKLYIHQKITKKSEVVSLFEGLRTISAKKANAYLALINKVLEQNEDISLKIAVLEDLQNNSWLFARQEKDPKYEILDEKKFLKEILPVYIAFEFNESTRTMGERFKIHKSINSIFDFFKAFDNLCDKQKELDAFIESGNRAILPNLIGFNLEEFDGKEVYKIKNDYQAFVHCAVMNAVYGALSTAQNVICIDEFQDLSMAEIKVLKSVYPHAVFNFYGDFKQCIAVKGNSTESSVKALFPPIRVYQINENYRNAMDITSYINHFLGTQMLPVGISGVVEKIKYIDYSSFKFENDDRIVYIAKDHDHLNYLFMSELGVLEGWKGKQAEQFPANVPVALSVQEVKGLEFEVVIVDFSEMTENEKYVASTRALSRLYVIDESQEENRS